MVCIICYESVLGDKNPHATVFFTAAASHKTCRPAALKCGHTFHKKCVETWFKTSKNTKCPVCNARHSGPVITLFIELDTTETSTSVKNATSIERNTCGTCMKDKEVDKEKQINNVVSEHETLSTEDNNIWRNLYITDLVHVSAAHNEKVSLLNKEICELKEKMAQMLEIHKGEMNRMKQSRATLETQVAQRKSMIYVIANKLKAEMAKNAEFVDMFNQLMDDSRRQQAYIKSLQEALLKARTRTDDKQLYLVRKHSNYK